MTAAIPSIGTIIHGTLITHDLLIRFADALEAYGEDTAEHVDLSREARARAAKLDEPLVDIEAMTEANDVLNDLFDALDVIAAHHGMYFGNTEGDASDFGFWPLPPSDENQP